MSTLASCEDTKTTGVAVSVPSNMVAGIEGYRWTRNTVGQAGGTVYRLHGKQNAPDLFLKFGQGGTADEITDEMVRLCWFAGRILVPRVVHFNRNGNEAWLLTTGLSGQMASEVLNSGTGSIVRVIDALAAFMRRMHAIPVAECPFNSDHAFRLIQARERIDADLVDPDDFDEEREGWTAEEVWAEIQSLRPLAPDPVVTHGDFSLENILIEDGEVVGCIDLGRAGIADRYQDIAIVWNYLAELDTSLQERFLEKYGVQELDHRKLRFHLLLDELF